LLTSLPNRVRVTEPRPRAWPDELPGGSQVPPEESRDLRSSKEPRPP
jgi:hypothetical protein